MSSASGSCFGGVREGSWRRALRQCWGEIIGKTYHSADTSQGEKVVVIESTSVLPRQVSEETLVKKDIAVYSALQVVRKGIYELSNSCPCPEFRGDEEVMIRNYATGLNPIDWKSVDYNFCLPEFPWVRLHSSTL